jgi:hypothetical protein
MKMSCPDLVSFWNQNQWQIAEALPMGTEALANVLQKGAHEFKLTQQIDGNYICWFTEEDELFLMFCIIPDPRDLDRVLDAYVQTKERRCPFTVILVNQWTDGEGTWDAFLITSKRVMQHGGWLCGTDIVKERGPELRADIYALFACGCEFTEPGEAQWAELLTGPVEAVIKQLSVLAEKHTCTQTDEDTLVRWTNAEGQLEALFFLLPSQNDIDAFIGIYQKIKETQYPVSFVFVESDQVGTCDVFRLSARSYLKHHNRVGDYCSDDKEPASQQFTQDNLDNIEAVELNNNVYRDGSKVWLDGIEGWSPSEKASSVHAAIEVVMRALGEDISYDYLVGISSLAFRMQVGGLCPSSPHPCCGYKCDRSLQVLPWKAKGFDIDQNKRQDLKEIFNVIVQSIDSGVPVTTGEEDDGLIIGYNKDKNELTCLHPWRFNGKKPFVIGLNDLPKICWGIGVYTERKTESIDEQALVIASLKQAVEMAKKGRVEGYAVGFEAWEAYINTLQALDKTKRRIPDDDILGNAWIYECLVQYREIAARYLNTIGDQFEETPKKHLLNVAHLYQQISEEILKGDKPVDKIAPYPKSLKKGKKWTKEIRQRQLNRLKEALPLEVQAINEIEKALSLILNSTTDFEVDKSEITE